MLTNDDIHAFSFGWGRDIIAGIAHGIHAFSFGWGRDIIAGIAHGIRPPYRRMMRRKIQRMVRNA